MRGLNLDLRGLDARLRGLNPDLRGLDPKIRGFPIVLRGLANKVKKPKKKSLTYEEIKDLVVLH